MRILIMIDSHGLHRCDELVKFENMLVVNPKSTRQSRSKYPETYMVLTYQESKIDIELKMLKHLKSLIDTKKIFKKNHTCGFFNFNI